MAVTPTFHISSSTGRRAQKADGPSVRQAGRAAHKSARTKEAAALGQSGWRNQAREGTKTWRGIARRSGREELVQASTPADLYISTYERTTSPGTPMYYVCRRSQITSRIVNSQPPRTPHPRHPSQSHGEPEAKSVSRKRGGVIKGKGGRVIHLKPRLDGHRPRRAMTALDLAHQTPSSRHHAGVKDQRLYDYLKLPCSLFQSRYRASHRNADERRRARFHHPCFLSTRKVATKTGTAAPV